MPHVQERTVPPADPDTKQKIEYISDMLLELKKMAESERLVVLGRILDLAHAEAVSRTQDL